MNRLLTLHAFVLFIFSQVAWASNQSELLIICNQNVKAGKGLALRYAEAYGFQENAILSIPMPTGESISISEYDQKIKPQVLKHLSANSQVKTLLTVYGVPLFVKDNQRIRSLDQLLSIIRMPQQLGDKLALNPIYFKVDLGDIPPPLTISRLDGPALRHAENMLANWLEFPRFGAWRRFLFNSSHSSLFSLLQHTYHRPAQDKSCLSNVPIDEIQFIQAQQKDLDQLMNRQHKRSLPLGSLVVHEMTENTQFGPFRSLDQSPASTACSLGAGFFIGTHNALLEDKELFDLHIFMENYLKGENFSSSIQKATLLLGGSLIILGDPLSIPFHKKAIAQQEEFYMSNSLPKKDEEYIRFFTYSKDWWLLNSYIRLWEELKFNIAITTLKVAISKRKSPVFFELLCRFYTEMDEKENLEKLIQKWPKKLLNTYYTDVINRAQAKIAQKAK
ncbi:MAG: hypothetical protein HQL32_06615 [Planctomycetes bacterium]|nr:hypothetical protein [Planctomycetota bacterium]